MRINLPIMRMRMSENAAAGHHERTSSCGWPADPGNSDICPIHVHSARGGHFGPLGRMVQRVREGRGLYLRPRDLGASRGFLITKKLSLGCCIAALTLLADAAPACALSFDSCARAELTQVIVEPAADGAHSPPYVTWTPSP